MRHKRGLIVDVSMDRMGDVIVRPRNKGVRAKMRAHNKEWTGHAEDTVFLQEGGPAAEFLEDLSPRQRSDIGQGWRVSFVMDPWVFGHLVGYDFQECI